MKSVKIVYILLQCNHQQLLIAFLRSKAKISIVFYETIKNLTKVMLVDIKIMKMKTTILDFNGNVNGQH